MNTLEALYAEICAHPSEDTPRLAYADLLDEQGDEESTKRAEFIRLQFEIDSIGPPHKESGSLCHELSDTRFCLYGSEDDGLKEGDRIDLDKSLYGLLVERIVPDDPTLGTVRYHLLLDEYSKPYPAKLVAEKKARAKELFQGGIAVEVGEGRCIASYPIVAFGDNGRVTQFVFEKGFASSLTCHWRDFQTRGDEWIRQHPIKSTTIIDHEFLVTISSTWKFVVHHNKECVTWDFHNKRVGTSFKDLQAVPEDALITILKARWPTIANWDVFGHEGSALVSLVSRLPKALREDTTEPRHAYRAGSE